MYKHLILLLFTITIASGCTTTPDMSEWANASEDLKTSVAVSQQTMLTTINQSVKDLKQGKEEGWENIDGELKAWGGNQAVFAENVAMIDTSLTIMVAYANEVSALAAAAESGKEASDSLFESMIGILDTVSAPFTGSQAALNGSKAIVDKVSEIVTRVQGQEQLHGAMSEMQPAVDLMAEQIVESSKLLSRLVSQSTRVQRKILRLQYGTNKEMYTNRLFKQTYQDIETLYKNAFDANSAMELNAVLGAKERLREDYRQYLSDKDTITAWREDTKAQLIAVIAASQQWRQSHLEAMALLKKCGGMRSLRKECGHLTVESLKASIDWVKATAALFKGEGDDPAED